MEFTLQTRIEALESKRAQLQSELDKGGEYIDDGYGEPTWEDYWPSRINQLKSEIQEIDQILEQMRQLRSLEVTIFIKSTKKPTHV